MTHEASGGGSDEKTVIGADAHHDFGERFKVLRWLGRGGMGDVYLAMDGHLHRRVAIKVIRPDLSEDMEIRQRIERECLLHAKVGPHPNIVTLFDKLERGSEIQLIMEYVEGETLRQYLDAHRDRNTEPMRSEAFRITMQMLEALSRIHAEGIVHRDIKPANVMLVRDDDGELRAKLMDFGIARLESGGSQFTNMMRTAAHSNMGSPGTPLYMAPEQFDSDAFGPVSARTDVYAMGVVFYELLAGKPPFLGSLTEILRGHLNSPPPPIQSATPVPAPLVSVIQTALAKKPGDRFITAAAFRDALMHLSEIESASLSEMAFLPNIQSDHRPKGKDDDDDIAATPPAPRPAHQAAPPPKRQPMYARVAVVAAGLLVLLGFVGILQVFSGGNEPVAPPFQEAKANIETPAAAPEELKTDSTVPAPTNTTAPPDAAVPVPHGDVTLPTGVSPDGSAVPVVQADTAAPLLTDTDVLLADPLPAATASPLGPDATAEAPANPIPGEGFSMSLEGVPLPGATSTSGAAATSESALQIIDQGSQERVHIVQPGDSLSAIAGQYAIDTYDLAIWNELERPNDLKVGQTLYLYRRPGIRTVTPQWERAAKKPEPEPVVETAPPPEPAPAPPEPAPVAAEPEKKGIRAKIGGFIDRMNEKQREKKQELQQERGQ